MHGRCKWELEGPTHFLALLRNGEVASVIGLEL